MSSRIDPQMGTFEIPACNQWVAGLQLKVSDKSIAFQDWPLLDPFFMYKEGITGSSLTD